MKVKLKNVQTGKVKEFNSKEDLFFFARYYLQGKEISSTLAEMINKNQVNKITVAGICDALHGTYNRIYK